MKLIEFEVGKKYTIKGAWEDSEYIYLTEEGFYKDEEGDFFSLSKWIIEEDKFIEFDLL